MSDRVTYKAVQCTFTGRTRDAVHIVAGGVSAWIPLSLIHGADELDFRRGRWLPGDVITLRTTNTKGRTNDPLDNSRHHIRHDRRRLHGTGEIDQA